MTLSKNHAPATLTALSLLAVSALAQETIDTPDLTPPGEQTVPVADDDNTVGAPEAVEDQVQTELSDEEQLATQFARYFAVLDGEARSDLGGV